MSLMSHGSYYDSPADEENSRLREELNELKELPKMGFSIRKSKNFRQMEPEDVVVGNTVYHFGDYETLYEFTIDEVNYPKDEYKAFTDEEGCRYGLKDSYVLVTQMSLKPEALRILENNKKIKAEMYKLINQIKE